MEILVHSQGLGIFEMPFAINRGDHNYRVGKVRLFAQIFEQNEPAAFRHRNIEDDQGGRVEFDDCQSFVAIYCLRDAKAAIGKRLSERENRINFVIDDQDVFSAVSLMFIV